MMGRKHLFEPVNLNGLHLKNRLIRSATWEGLADSAGHLPESLFQIYDRLARGGVGCIISSFTSVLDNDDYADGMMRLSNDGLIPEHRRLTGLVHQQGCPIIAQLALGGYNGTGKGTAFHDVPIDNLSENDIQNIKSLFAGAALRAQQAGYDGVQIHAAHGFFLSRFISPAYNHRQDAYGGNDEGRGRILADILKGIREKAPALHITMKINASDFMHGGLSPSDSLSICKQCAVAGMDSIEVSGNGPSVPGVKPGVNEAYFKDFALTLAEEVKIPIILVGGHRSFENMEKVLNEGEIACLSLSRPLIREPDLPMRWARGDTSPSECISCNRCYRTPGHQCIFKM